MIERTLAAIFLIASVASTPFWGDPLKAGLWIAFVVLVVGLYCARTRA